MPGNRGNALSRFDERSSGDGGGRCTGAVALRNGLRKGDLCPSLIGDTLRDGEALTGVNSSCGKYGRSAILV